MINSVHVPYRQISEDQKTQYAQNDGQCHEKTGYTVEEPEESPETDDGHGGPYRRYTVGIEPAEYDGCCYGQRKCPCPSAVRYLSDTFFCFHNLHVFGGNAIPGFRGFLAVRLHRQGFRGKYRSGARMIFPETCKARPCRWKRAGCDLCPANRDGFIISFSCRSRFWGTRVSG